MSKDAALTQTAAHSCGDCSSGPPCRCHPGLPTQTAEIRSRQARAGLVHLRAGIVRLAHEVEGAADNMTGKGAPRARAEAARLANKMRDLAMTTDMVEASK
jgi:hypothetical protein